MIGSTNDYLCNDSISVNIIALSCLASTAMAGTNSLSSTSAEVSWTENGTATSYRIEYDAAGYAAGTARNTSVVTDTFSIISGLMSNSNYDWNVQALCSATDLSSLVGGSFTTPCTLFAAPFVETFTNFVPECWDEASTGDLTTGPATLGSGNWGYGSFANTASNSGGAKINLYFNNRTEWIISSIIDLNGGTYKLVIDAAVTVWNGSSSNTMGSDDSVQFAISTDNSLSWTSIYVWEVNNQPSAGGAPYIIDLAANTGASNIIGIYATDGPVLDPEDYDFHIGNFKVRQSPLVYYTLGTINTENGTGVADSVSVNCAISGTAVGVNRIGSGYEFTLIDMRSGSQAGITMFGFNSLPHYTAITDGDSLYIEGDVAQYNGLTQFNPDTITLISSKNTIPAPIVVSDLDETTESKWLSIPTNWVSLSTSGSGSSNIDLTNGTDTILMRIVSDTDVNDSLVASGMPIIPSDNICGLFGIGGQFDNSSPFTGGYQIFPMRWSDLTICRNTVGIEDRKLLLLHSNCFQTQQMVCLKSDRMDLTTLP